MVFLVLKLIRNLSSYNSLNIFHSNGCCVFNIGNPRATVTVANLAHLVKRLAQSDSNVIYGYKDYADIELRIPSIKKAQNMLGYWPKVDLEEGLLRTIEWYREQLDDQVDQT